MHVVNDIPISELFGSNGPFNEFDISQKLKANKTRKEKDNVYVRTNINIII